MDLGSYASYPLPPSIRTAFGVQTAQELADSLGAEGELTPEVAREAERAFDAYRAGDASAARTFLTSRAGLSEAAADDALARLPKA